jgi:hypothetical protein
MKHQASLQEVTPTLHCAHMPLVAQQRPQRDAAQNFGEENEKKNTRRHIREIPFK